MLTVLALAPIALMVELDIEEVGYKFHMNNVSAAVGRENLKHLDWMLMRHRDNAKFYDAAFGGSHTIRVAPQHPDGVSACAKRARISTATSWSC